MSYKYEAIKGRKVVITAGPTREEIDPVRFISNYSSGKMGFALAQAAAERGASVTLVCGPVSLETPKGVERVDVISAKQMLSACERLMPCDVFIGAAAVADYRPGVIASKKIKKEPGGQQGITLELVRNPDIIKIVSERPDRPFTVGFAAETDNFVSNAIKKITSKKLDLIILNDVTNKGNAFGSDFNAVLVIDGLLNQYKFKRALKIKIAHGIIRVISSALACNLHD